MIYSIGALVLLSGLQLSQGNTISIKTCEDASIDVPGSLFKMRTYECLKTCQQIAKNSESEREKLLSFVDDQPGYSKLSQCCCLHDVDQVPYLKLNGISLESPRKNTEATSIEKEQVVFDCKSSEHYEAVVADMSEVEIERISTICNYLSHSQPLSIVEIKHLIALLLDMQDNYYYNPDWLSYEIILDEEIKKLMNSKTIWWDTIKQIGLPVDPEFMNDKKFCQIYENMVVGSSENNDAELRKKSKLVSKYIGLARGQGSTVINKALDHYLKQLKQLCLPDVTVQNRETRGDIEKKREEEILTKKMSVIKKRAKLQQEASHDVTLAKPWLIKKKLRVNSINVRRPTINDV